jgi:predicted unusual protein kinase regulating ubiquinone biosynthesis (AarF/ABC1/UbiB family)
MQSLKNPLSTSTSPAPPNGHVAAPTPPLPPRTVPNAAKPRHRSLRMQYRFVRVVTYASWLFIRLTIWQVVLKRYFPEWVERGNLERWKKYARQFRGIAFDMGGVMIKLGQFISTRADILPQEVIDELITLRDGRVLEPFEARGD